VPIAGFKLQFTISREKESLADATLGISARQQCVYEGPSQRNLQQINHMRFPIDSYGNRGRITYFLRDIFA